MAESGVLVSKGPGRVFASPLSRALARQKGFDLAGLAGSGPQGRIVKADLLSALARPATAPAADAQGEAAYDAIPNSIGRKLIARRLTEAKQQAPHFYVRADCNLDALLKWRARTGATARHSLSAYVVKAAALALNAFPGVNASYTEAAIRRYRRVNIALAVAVDDGLRTPVIANADQCSIAQIAVAAKELAAQARAGTLATAASRGATFTISNLGAEGVREFVAVINPPQAAILAVGAAEPRPVVQDGKLAVATVMTVTLSVDHRAIDGVLAGRWMAAFKRHLENPAWLEASNGEPPPP